MLDLQKIRAQFTRLPATVRETPVTLGHLVAFTQAILEAVDKIIVEIESLKRLPEMQQKPNHEIGPGPTVRRTEN